MSCATVTHTTHRAHPAICLRLLARRVSSNAFEEGNEVNEREARLREANRKKQKRFYEKNREAKKEYQRAYYAQNQRVITEAQRRGYSENPNPKRDYQKQYYLKNREAITETRKEKKEFNKEYQRRRYQNPVHREAIRETQKNYYNKNRAAYIEYRRRREQEKKEATKILVQEHGETIKAELESKFGISSPEDWYTITRTQFHATTELSEVSKKATKLPFLDLLQELYPLQVWKPENLLNVPTSTWRDQKKTRDFLEALEPELFISKKDDWYHIARKQLYFVGAKSCVVYFKYRIADMLQFAFPEIAWDLTKFSNRSKKASQRWLLQTITELFPGETIHTDYIHPDSTKKDASCSGGTKMSRIELDIWIPGLSLALEYQGEHHYHNFANFIGGSSILVSEQQARDYYKRYFCSNASIELVEVPYWWDGNKETLKQILEEKS
eukprot:TRINITY_DN4596_c0_g1_i1.p1 TRINITY_DN4596_c0_g1~~TRINITY_DN4596_c0_g1_i1.p1  ORF type:complete len:448 (-),score=70.54 TRINITY_DN4596_c0_g1_i1:103-1425(-)